MVSEKKSYNDHIFVLHSIVNNRINKKLDTLSAFLDLKKTFDSVNKDSLLYKEERSSGHLKLSLVGLPINGKQNSTEIINNQTIDDIDIVKQQV